MKSALLATALAVGATLTGTATAQAQPLNWQPCPEDAQVQCATITVPIDHARPATGTTQVAIARKPAADPANRIGVLLLMPGGPGGSGVDDLFNDARLPAELGRRFDLVSFDPRGTNRSTPVRCDATLAANPPNLVPETGGTLAAVKAYSRVLGESCREHTGPLIDHVDSVSVARDIDEIRAALGERKLTMYGGSYGTLTGQMYAETFPHRVRALLLDSVFDHSLPLSRFVLSEAENGEDSFTEFAKWCAADAACALHGQDVGQVYGDVFAKALRGELPLDPIQLAATMLGHFAGPTWAEGAEFLQSLSEQQARTEPSEAVPYPTIPLLCADHEFRFASEQEFQSLWRKQGTVAPTMRTHFAWGLAPLCADWPARVGNPQHRTDVSGAPPILIMNGRHDPASAYEWAKNVHRQLRGSVLLTYDGWGHDVLMRNDCMINAGTAYLVHRTLPRPGTHCPAEMGDK